MTTKYLRYKGYLGTIEPQLEDGCLYGKLAFIRDLVTYEANTLPDLEAQFHKSVDGYLSDCAELNKEPEKPFKGSLNIRIGSELHREAVLASDDQTLNAFICDAIAEKVKRCKKRGATQ